MQIIYAAPFILLSIVAFLVCLAAPRLRQYRLQALVAPLAFGFFSIVGMGAIVLLGDLMGDVLHLRVFSEPISGVRGVLSLVLLYFVPGLLGSWLAVAVVNRVTADR